jgi:hypothetical protein
MAFYLCHRVLVVRLQRNGVESERMTVSLGLAQPPICEDDYDGTAHSLAWIVEREEKQKVCEEHLVKLCTQLATRRFDADPYNPWVVVPSSVNLSKANKLGHKSSRVNFYVDEDTGSVTSA